MSLLASLGENFFSFILVFIIFICVYFFIRNKLQTKKIKRLKFQQKNKATPTIYGFENSQSGIILVSKPIKPFGERSNISYDIRNEPRITSINYKGVFDLEINIDDNNEKEEIIIHGDKSFVDLITLDYAADTLLITHQQISCIYELDCKIIIKVKTINSVFNKGQGEIYINGLKQDNFSFNNQSIQDAYIEGQVENLRITNLSQGNVFAEKCLSNSAYIENNNIGNVFAYVSDKATCRINDSGNIRLKNTPNEIIKQHIKGTGRIYSRSFDESLSDMIAFKIYAFLDRFKKEN